MLRTLGWTFAFACMLALAGCMDSHTALDPQGSASGAERNARASGAAGAAAPEAEAATPYTPEAEARAPLPEDEPAEPVQAANPTAPTAGCPDLSMLVARDGAIAFAPDQSAVISVTLENTGDADFLNYPGLRVRFWLVNSYQPAQDGDLLLYGLGPHDHWDHTIAVAAADLPAYGRELVVQAEPFALGMSNQDCRRGEIFEFSAAIPQP